MKLQFITIAVSDIARARAFYEGVLGFKPSGSYGDWQSYENEGGGGFGIIENHGLRRASCLDIVNFSLPDIDSMWERVRGHVHVESPPQVMPWGTRKFVILDPDGMRLGFVERTDSSNVVA